MSGYFSPGRRVIQPARPFGRRMAAGLGVSLASAAAMIWANPALADDTITAQTTTPVATSTATNNGPDNIVISTGATIKPTSAPGGAAVTLDSNNTVSNAGTIQFQDVNSITAVLVKGGFTGSVGNTGAITVNDTSTNKDTNGDGVLDGPITTGTGRFGIRVIGSAPFVGSISNNAGGVITVQGDDSAGISVETSVQGSVTNIGGINATGARIVGLRTTAPVSGNVATYGTITATGQGAQAISVGGAVSGGVVIEGAVTSTGYSVVSRSTDPAAVAKLLPSNLLQGGSAVTIAASVGQGLLVDVAPTASTTNTDVNNNGVPDANESTGNIVTYGGAPAVVVGAVGSNVALGNVGTDTNAYGVVINGSVLGTGVYDGVAATGMQLGVTGGGAVTTGGGVRITGTVTAAAAQAGADGFLIKSGASVPVLKVEGGIASGITSTSVNLARGLAIEQGGNLGFLSISGRITANASSDVASATAIIDKSGTLSTIQSTGTISATVVSQTANVTPSGSAIAMDLSANTGGVAILQYDVSGGTALPSIAGSVLLGSGSDSVDLEAGTLTGNLSFGAGANTLTLNGGATVTGNLTATGGTLGLAINSGALTINNAVKLNVTNLNLGAAGQLVVSADPAAGVATELDVSGRATIAAGAKIGVRLNSVLEGSATYTIVRAASLTAGAIDTSLLGSTPYLYNVSLSTNAAAGTVAINLSTKTATQLQLPTTIQGALSPILAVANSDSRVRTALLDPTTRAGFLTVYNQLLPNHSGGVFRISEAATLAAGRPLDDRRDPEGGGGWVQETNYGMTSNGPADIPGYKAWGIGLVGGYEMHATPIGIFGITTAVSSSQLQDNGMPSAANLVINTLEGGGYWRDSWGPLAASARLAGQYVTLRNDRATAFSANNLFLFSATSKGRWTGTGVTGRFRVSYEQQFGRFYARPEAGIDYYRLAEGSYTESGGGSALDLSVGARTSSELSGYAGMAFGATFGPAESPWGPELILGYRGSASDQIGSTTAKFASGGSNFTVGPNAQTGGGAVAHLSIKGENGSGGFAVEGGTEYRNGSQIYDLRLTAHLQF